MRKKHFLIIGGTHGIGKELVRSLEKQRHKLSVVSRQLPIQPQGSRANVHYWQIDLSQKDNLTKTFTPILEQDGKISHLIFAQRYRGTDDNWEGEYAVSLTATKKIIECVSDYFDDTPERSIVIISSLSSTLISLEQPVSYHVGKAGLIALARYFAVILGPKGIRVNCVSPITILKDESKHVYLKNIKLHNLYKQIIPLGRMGTAKEIADIVEFLCSPASTFITGQNIIADGGLTLQSQEALARNLTSLVHPAIRKS